MEWTLPETITVGAAIGGIIVLLLGIIRIIGQRTDPQLIGVLNTISEANAKSDERMAGVIGRLTDTITNYSKELSAMKSGMETVFSSVVMLIESSEANATARQIEVLEAWTAFRGNVQKEHKDHDDNLVTITGKLDELKQQSEATQIQSEGFRKVVDKAMTTHSKRNGEIEAALKRIELGQDRIQSVFQELLESNRRNEKLMMQLMEKPQQDISAVKADIASEPEFIAPVKPIEIDTSKTTGIPMIPQVTNEDETKDKSND